MASQKLLAAKKMVKEIDLKFYLKKWAKANDESFRNLSVRMGMNHTFMYSKCAKGDLTGTEMLLIATHLKVNPMELFINKLPEHLRPTKAEKELKTELDAVKKELEAVKQERDLFKEMLLKK